MKKNEEKIGNGSEPPTFSTFSGISGYHTPVLLKEVIENVDIKSEGIYVDCTFGGGGHSGAILSNLNEKGRLIAFDQDSDAITNVPNDPRVLFVPQNFRYLRRFLLLNDIPEVDGVLADLGVSSFQFDEAKRGFSTRYNSSLDMRMDQRQERDASKVVNTYSEEQLHKLFEQFGEVTNAKTAARVIVESRKVSFFKTTDDLKNALAPFVRGNPNKYFARLFQAIRIEVNEEIIALKEMLIQLPLILKVGGRAAIISFHSVEDRLVKTFFRDNHFEGEDYHPFESPEKKILMKAINKKPITPSEEEIKINPRSRSAKLRVAEKI